MNNYKIERHKKRKIVAIFFRINPIDSLNVLLYACNGSMYKWLFLYNSKQENLFSTKVG